MAKLTKEQLKKLYDYGGTLSPKDWADMIDSIPENPIYRDSLPIIKTTYKEVRELYYAGKMDPNIKYEFAYTFKTSFNTIYPVSNLQLYITPSGDLKAEGAGNDSTAFYPFVADFEFDKLLVQNIVVGTNSYRYVYEDFKFHTLDIEDTNYGLFDILEQYNIEYETRYDTEEYRPLFIKDVVIFNTYLYNEDMGEYCTYYYLITKSGIKIQFSPDDIDINVTNINITPVAAIYNIQYNNKFHYKLLDGINEDYDYFMLQCNASVYGSDYSDYINWDSFIAQDLDTIPHGVIINSQLSQISPEINDYSMVCMVSNSNFNSDY